ncbi:transposase [Methylocapsa polymorpha]|uniref:transposase n=1 Tax=Methylocapsa polymorpha TaxID=3080828 RepID=UPI00388CF3C1
MVTFGEFHAALRSSASPAKSGVSATRGTVRNLVCWAIVEPLEADYGDQEGDTGPASLLSGRDPKDVFSKDGLFGELKKALAERVLNAELHDHLEGEAAAGKSNHRNGYSKKTVLTETSKIDIKVPRDRERSFDPKLIARYQRRFPGFDEKIVSMYARGMTVREIQGHLMELYGAGSLAGPDLDDHRRRSGNGRRMAEPAARGDVSAGVL